MDWALQFVALEIFGERGAAFDDHWQLTANLIQLEYLCWVVKSSAVKPTAENARNNASMQ
jgi:hypothetical protein